MMNIVIVDDDKAAAETLAQKLQSFEGANVTGIANNGIEGLHLMNEKHPDVLFLDIELPDISGIEFLERINCYPNGNCHVVMYTAHDRFMLSAFRKKAYDYLMKPIDDTELRGIIRRICIDQTSNNFHNMPPKVNNSTCQDDDEAAQGAASADNSDGIACRNDGKFIVYTNSVDFRLVDIREIGVFTYNHDMRVWEVTISGQKHAIRLKRNVNSDVILALNDQLVRVSQKHIINLSYLMEVTNNPCRFYPPFDKIDNVKVGRFFRKKLIDQFSSF